MPASIFSCLSPSLCASAMGGGASWGAEPEPELWTGRGMDDGIGNFFFFFSSPFQSCKAGGRSKSVLDVAISARMNDVRREDHGGIGSDSVAGNLEWEILDDEERVQADAIWKGRVANLCGSIS